MFQQLHVRLTTAGNDLIVLLVAHDAIWWGSLLLIVGRLAVLAWDCVDRWRARLKTPATPANPAR